MTQFSFALCKRYGTDEPFVRSGQEINNDESLNFSFFNIFDFI